MASSSTAFPTRTPAAATIQTTDSRSNNNYYRPTIDSDELIHRRRVEHAATVSLNTGQLSTNICTNQTAPSGGIAGHDMTRMGLCCVLRVTFLFVSLSNPVLSLIRNDCPLGR